MKKKAALVLCIIFAAVSIGGCWSYRSLSDMSIISAIAVDLNDAAGYDLTFEAVDLSGPVKQQGIKTYFIQSQGATVFDAVRNAQKKNTDTLYFGHVQAVIISEDVARSRDISGLIDWFVRDSEVRETISVVISAGSARGLISVKPNGTPLLGMNIMKIMEDDKRYTLSVPYVELYNIYDMINGEGISPALPVFHLAESWGEPDVETYGTAVYKGQRMAGTLSSGETKYFLFIRGKVEGGVLTFPSSGEGADDTALEISRNDTDVSFSYKNGRLKINIKTATYAFLHEYQRPTGDISEETIHALEKAAAECLARRIGDVIKKVQTEYGSDIFGFGSMVYKHDPALWKQLKENWNETFASLDVDVQCRIEIIGTATIKE